MKIDFQKRIRKEIAAAGLMLVLLGGTTYFGVQRTRTLIHERQTTADAFRLLQKNADEMKLDARMRVYSGELAWENRFFSNLDKISETLESLSKALLDQDRLEHIHIDTKLYVDIVEKAFEYSQKEQNKLARSTITSLDFERAEFEFTDELSRLITDLRSRADGMHQSVIQYQKISGILVIFLALMFSLTTITIVRQYSAWAREIQSLNAELESKVNKQVSQIAKQQELLANKVKMASLGEMAGGVAHEVNNPLMVIRGKASQLIQRGDAISPEQKKNNLDLIVSYCDRIAKIVSGLKIFSRNAEADPLSWSSVQTIVTDTVSLCGEKFKFMGIHVSIEGDFDVEIKCRPTQISQVLLNLMSNSADAIESLTEKWVKIESQVDNSSTNPAWILRVTDSGKGISREIASKIMQPFFTTKQLGKGTGLGLSISKGIIEEHDGELSIDESSPHTCFVVRIPQVRKVVQVSLAPEKREAVG